MPNYTRQYQSYAAALVRPRGGSAGSRPIAGTVVSRARTSIDSHFRSNPDHRLRHLYFVGHGSLGDFALSGHLIAGEFVALSTGSRLDAGDSSFWRTVVGKMLVADDSMGQAPHNIDFRACNLGAGSLATLIANTFGRRELLGSVYSSRAGFEFQPERRGGHLRIRARTEGGNWVYPPARPRGGTARIVSFGGGG